MERLKVDERVEREGKDGQRGCRRKRMKYRRECVIKGNGKK